jgi:hypothetical protein
MFQDYDTINSTLEEFSTIMSSHSKLIIVLFILAVGNIIAIVLRFWGDWSLKNKEKELHSFTLKEKKRIEVFEFLYNEIDSLGLMNDSNLMLQKITDIERFIITRRLYINRDLKSLTEDALDYFKRVMTNPRRKNYQTELDFMDRFCDLFA